MVIFLYNLYIFVWIQHCCLANMVFAVAANNSVTEVVAGLGGSVGCAVRLETGGRGFNPRQGRQHSFVEIDRDIFSTVILSLLLIQEGQLSVSSERMSTILVNRLED